MSKFYMEQQNLVLNMSFRVNLGENFKKLLSYLKSTPCNLSYAKFHGKQKTLMSLRPKFFPYLGTFKPEFEKNYYRI